MYKVILVDDERFILTSMERRLPWQKNGFQIVGRYTSPYAALRAVETLHPDVLFTDIRMPGMSGLDLLGEISRNYPNVRTVVASGYADFEYAKNAMRFGAFGFCVKPFEYEEFDDLLGRLRRELDKFKAEIDFVSLLTQNTPESTELVLQRMNLAGLSSHNRLVAAVCADEILIPPETPALRFQYRNQFAMLLCYSNWKQLQTKKPLGISMPFSGCNRILPALAQAEEALLQPFVSGEMINHWCDNHLWPEIAQLLRNLQQSYAARDMAQVRNDFSTLRSICTSKDTSVSVIFQVYNALATMGTADQLPHDWQQNCAAMVSYYENAQSMFHILEELLVVSLTNNHFKSSNSTPMSELLLYVDTHYYDPELTLQSLSERFCFSQNHISQTFRKLKGIRFTTYLTMLRIEHAKELLMHSTLSIQEVAMHTGYLDYFYFARVFKSQTGMSAGTYREQYGIHPTKKKESP